MSNALWQRRVASEIGTFAVVSLIILLISGIGYALKVAGVISGLAGDVVRVVAGTCAGCLVMWGVRVQAQVNPTTSTLSRQTKFFGFVGLSFLAMASVLYSNTFSPSGSSHVSEQLLLNAENMTVTLSVIKGLFVAETSRLATRDSAVSAWPRSFPDLTQTP